jgi:hypothetical protein
LNDILKTSTELANKSKIFVKTNILFRLRGVLWVFQLLTVFSVFSYYEIFKFLLTFQKKQYQIHNRPRNTHAHYPRKKIKANRRLYQLILFDAVYLICVLEPCVYVSKIKFVLMIFELLVLCILYKFFTITHEKSTRIA